MIIHETKVPTFFSNELQFKLNQAGWNDGSALVLESKYCNIQFLRDEDAAMYEMMGIGKQFIGYKITASQTPTNKRFYHKKYIT